MMKQWEKEPNKETKIKESPLSCSLLSSGLGELYELPSSDESNHS